MTAQIKTIDLTPKERERLEKIVRKTSSPQALALRSRIILMTATGVPVTKICEALHTTRTTISKWKKRYIGRGIDGLRDSQRPGKPRKYGNSLYSQIIDLSTSLTPEGRRQWSVRGMARRLGVNRGVVQRTLLREMMENKSAS